MQVPDGSRIRDSGLRRRAVPGPVRADRAHPGVSNDEFRVTGRQPAYSLGDPNNPILQPWAADVIRKRNELVLSGKPVFS
jgi:hypothetical protein